MKLIYFLIIWYLFMSFVDWYIHKYILHNNDTYFKHLRHLHKIHHSEYKNNDPTSITGIYFNIYHTIFLYITTLPVIYLFTRLLKIPVTTTLLIHFFLVYCTIGAHNNCHGEFHNQNVLIENVPYCYVPQIFKKVIQKHHDLHHANPTKNFCAVLLGFDFFI